METLAFSCFLTHEKEKKKQPKRTIALELVNAIQIK